MPYNVKESPSAIGANKNEGIIIPTRQRIKVDSRVTVDAPFPGIDTGSAMKVNGSTFASEAEEFAEIQGPVLEIFEYWMLVITALALPRLLKTTDWSTPPGCWPVMTPEKLRVFGVIVRRWASLCAIPFNLVGVLMLYPEAA